MKICVYCGKPIGGDPPFTVEHARQGELVQESCCSERCREKAQSYFRRIRWGKPVSYLLLILAVLLVLTRSMGWAQGKLLPLAGVALFGITLLLFPFSSGEAAQRMGMKAAAATTRIIGVVLALLFGLLLWFL